LRTLRATALQELAGRFPHRTRRDTPPGSDRTHLQRRPRRLTGALKGVKTYVQPRIRVLTPFRVTFARIPRERNGVADELAKDGARASKALSADRRR